MNSLLMVRIYRSNEKSHYAKRREKQSGSCTGKFFWRSSHSCNLINTGLEPGGEGTQEAQAVSTAWPGVSAAAGWKTVETVSVHRGCLHPAEAGC
jgi:hypothetical protein